MSCQTTGKRQYRTKRHARRARNQTPNTRDGGAMGIYRCDDCGYYHLGHKPRDVARGTLSKDEWLQQRQRGDS